MLGVQVSGTGKEMMTENLTAQAQTGAEDVDAFLAGHFGLVNAMLQSCAVTSVEAGSAKTTADHAANFPDLLPELSEAQMKKAGTHKSV